jgi:hypothetical protein
MLTNHCRQFKAVDFRHGSVDEHDRDVGLKMVRNASSAEVTVIRFLPNSRRITSELRSLAD